MKGSTKLTYIGPIGSKHKFQEVESEEEVILTIYKTKKEILDKIKPGQTAMALINEGFLNEWDILEEICEEDIAEGQKQLDLNYKTKEQKKQESKSTPQPGPSPTISKSEKKEVQKKIEINPTTNLKAMANSVTPKIAVLKKIQLIQKQLKIDKANNVKAGAKTFNYWSTDDILKKVKPLLDEHNCIIELSDKIIHFQDEGKIITKTKNKLGDPLITQSTQSRFYIQSTATLYDCETGGFIESTANAREQNEKLGMDEPQLTGSSSSYARKFALSGLLLLDDNKDPDNK